MEPSGRERTVMDSGVARPYSPAVVSTHCCCGRCKVQRARGCLDHASARQLLCCPMWGQGRLASWGFVTLCLIPPLGEPHFLMRSLKPAAPSIWDLKSFASAAAFPR